MIDVANNVHGSSIPEGNRRCQARYRKNLNNKGMHYTLHERRGFNYSSSITGSVD